MKNFFIMLIILGCSTVAYAATPTISKVTGTIQTGQTLTISGANMVQENKTNWSPWHSDHPNAWSFEGASPSADGYSAIGPSGGAYDSSVKILGSQSIKFHVTGPSTENVADYNAYPIGGNTQDMWYRYYVRFNAAGWFDNYCKQLYIMGTGGNYYFDLKGTANNSMPSLGFFDSGDGNVYGDIPNGQLQNGRWYCVETHYRDSSPRTAEVYIDGVRIIQTTPSSSRSQAYVLFGIPNAKSSPSGLNVTTWWDGLVSSTSRIYAASTIELSNSPTYGQGTIKYQEPIYLSDGSVQIKADLTGLGSGPYYLWVTNNRQERSTAYNLSSGSSSSSNSAPTPTPDTTNPTVSISAPTAGTVSGTVSVAAQAGDNVGVAGVQFRLNGTNLGSEITSAPYSLSWDTTTYQNGTYVLTAVARDAAGNTSTSSSVQITVNNSSTSGSVLFEENFEDSNLSGKGWYDNPSLVLSSSEHIPGSTKSAEFSFASGATQPSSGGAIRKQFAETDSVYVSYWIKYGSNWKEQTGGFGHHEIYLLTNQDDAWSNLAFTHLTSYIESWGTYNQAVPVTPEISFQDGVNIDQTKINVDLTRSTENRAVNGCNGASDTYGTECYNTGNGTYLNGKFIAGQTGSVSIGTWHRVEVFIKLNSIKNGKGVADGTIAYWLDGKQLFQHNDVMMRTAQYPNMKFNQFVIAPWMGNGAPGNQSFWIDDLKVATSRSGDTPSSPLNPPSNLKIVSAQ